MKVWIEHHYDVRKGQKCSSATGFNIDLEDINVDNLQQLSDKFMEITKLLETKGEKLYAKIELMGSDS